MGPTLNVEGLLRLPDGCGEQNMVNFAPSIYIMKYLSTVGQLTRSVENKAKNIMTIGTINTFCNNRNHRLCRRGFGPPGGGAKVCEPDGFNIFQFP